MPYDNSAEGTSVILHHNGLCLTLKDHQWTVSVLGRLTQLAVLEGILMYIFMTNPGKVFSRMEIMNSIGIYLRSPGYATSYRSIDSLIKRLRRKLFPCHYEAAHLLIKTRYGGGYILQDLRTTLIFWHGNIRQIPYRARN